ncbi:Spo0E family sporulation regulatory protein-aspartic acid phosphatase [Fictibacillus iocasae]|uniref:Spo0E family sporulation regulatory protein-aspartic acid phosphatase n=1 Tax=Fictibacillus iocasae TaxID=2715437 RepID=A0ABW2NU96_9BACL
MNRDLLLMEIEHSRKQMNELSKHLPLIADEVVELSQYIDRLLNEFHQLKTKKQLL